MGWRDWTGVAQRRWKTAPNEQVQPSKTPWDLLQLLIVPGAWSGRCRCEKRTGAMGRIPVRRNNHVGRSRPGQASQDVP
jgi:hypothetical protein